MNMCMDKPTALNRTEGTRGPQVEKCKNDVQTAQSGVQTGQSEVQTGQSRVSPKSKKRPVGRPKVLTWS